MTDPREISTLDDLAALDFAKSGGVVTVVAQDVASGAVLMVAQAAPDALVLSLETGEMHYTSRSRGLWRKGATSGNIQRVEQLRGDCDGDSVLARVASAGPACHTGAVTCFGDSHAHELARLDATIAARQDTAPAGSYTRRLLGDRNLRLKKLGEEVAELVLACADGDRERAAAECADLLYHALVALRGVGAGLNEVEQNLRSRRR
jgi:phosphoribosyl-ATP pyrophosphohydrolase/phosphoribosyl-AMP cyclohydrolase